ncbi:aspartate aminotransferase, cytoplasmic [Chaetomium globosum CBS 148.51]|uniref:Aspartate aminotransferase n=1 Tax=Chaetomium globosum (strain ATCC 6205 / CBS 148.51 / DSM 1962 / NBRC 6347 / NRRL 1970) TaxID=306901 RepID=Q2GZK5_CHAGB|nr:aspartate aminotransferase, cytoplasmic [Chaetomium globosum CBS 148.51]EAQ88422.1 aspartate aminotransferase, cytoplasmic [Chaetomium globosum CBS 148.51]
MSPSSITSFPAEAVPQAPEDPLFGLMRAYKADTSPDKVDLGIGAYRDDNAKPWVLPVVKKADEILRNDPEANHEYLPIAGLAALTSKAAELLLGKSAPAIAEKRAASVQTISGTGAVHLGALFLARFYKSQGANRTVYVSNPTWANHHQIFTNVGLPIATYPYFSKETKGLDFDGMKATLEQAPDGSIVLLHACAHNPTGVDPTPEAATLNRDAGAIRLFVEQGFELDIAQSFAKNFGLYGQRAGCFHYVAAPAADAVETTTREASQLAILQRSEISNPPIYGARIASIVLNDPALFAEWQEKLRTMSGRIIDMRKKLRTKLEDLKIYASRPHHRPDRHVQLHGVSEPQVLKLRTDFHIYMTKNERISMAYLNSRNVAYVATAVDKVVREAQ